MNAGPKPDLVIAAASPSPVHLDSRELFRSGNEVVIVHKGEEYRLRITRQNKQGGQQKAMTFMTKGENYEAKHTRAH